jgi:FkbM family methyltransferase
MTLTKLLNESYTQHPAFQFEEQWAEPNKNLVNDFNVIYNYLSKNCDQNSQSYDQKVESLFFILADIFAALQIQTNNKHESIFLQELHNECVKLISNEVNFFKKTNSKNNCLNSKKINTASKFIFDVSQRHGFGAISKASVETIMMIGSQYIKRFKHNASVGKTSREDLSINTGIEVKQIIDILSKEFNELGVIDQLSKYIGAEVYVYGVALELSVPNSNWWHHNYSDNSLSPKTLYLHIDESKENPKAIVYLTDVTTANGPTSIYPYLFENFQFNSLQEIIGRVIGIVGSSASSELFSLYKRKYHQAMSSELFRKHFMKLPSTLRFNSHFGWDILSGSVIEKKIADTERIFTGEKGSFIAFDGAKLFHRGGLVQSGDRVALQVIFSEKYDVPKLVLPISMIKKIRSIIRNIIPNFIYKLAQKMVYKKEIYPSEDDLTLFSRNLPNVLCIDVGASYFPHTQWSIFLASKNTRWVAVEPNEKNLGYIENWPHAASVFKVPTAISENGGDQSLYVTNVDSGSSLLEPELTPSNSHRFHNKEYFFPFKKTLISTLQLTDVINTYSNGCPIFIKLDTQGTELSILKSATTYFQSHSIVGIELESTLQSIPIMKNSGKFWEVCKFLEENGFELLSLNPIQFNSVIPHNNNGKRVLNECDSIFSLRRDIVLSKPIEFQLSLFTFYLTNFFYEEAYSFLLDNINISNHLKDKKIDPIKLANLIYQKFDI